MPDINDLFPSKWLRASDLPQGGTTVQIAAMRMEEVEEGKPAKPVLFFNGAKKGLVMNKTNAQMIAHTYGAVTESWINRPLHLYVEPVSFQGKIVDAIRCRVPQEAVTGAGAPTPSAAMPDTQPTPDTSSQAATGSTQPADFDDDIPF